MNVYAAASTFLLTGMLSTQALAERKYSDWEPAIRLAAVGGCDGLQSEFRDVAPTISKNGRSLYFASNRTGILQIYVAQRASRHAPWGLPIKLGEEINSPPDSLPVVNVNIPSLSRDGHWLFFNSDRPGGAGSTDIWVSYRARVRDDLAWETPMNLGPGVNTALVDGGANYFENKHGSAPQLFFTRGTDIMVSELQPDGTFGPGIPVAGINSPQSDQRPSMRFDGLELFFFSNRGGNNDIWVTTRESIDDPWSPPTKLGEQVNTASSDITPHLSPDGLTLFFASNRPGPDACGSEDLYMTTRTKLKDDGDQREHEGEDEDDD